MKHNISIKNKLKLTNIAIIILALISTLIASLTISIKIIEKNITTNISNISQLISESNLVKESIINGVADKNLTNYLDSNIKLLKDVDIIVIADRNGKRIYHPEKEKIGQSFIGGDEKLALSQNDGYISEAIGSLGAQKRAFKPIINDNKIIGFVMSSALLNNIMKAKKSVIAVHLFLGTILISITLLISFIQYKNFKKSLLGYDPEEFKELYLHKDEILSSLADGILAVDTLGNINLINESALNILKLDKNIIKYKNIKDIFTDDRVLNILRKNKNQYNEQIKINSTVILLSTILIKEDNRTVGEVIIVRDKTEVTLLAEELTGVNEIVDSLRANTHEFMNKLHVILGLIQTDHINEAKKYIVDITELQKDILYSITDKIKDPKVAALLLGKISRANELGIDINLSQDSHLDKDNKLLNSNDLVTIIGNLIQNSMDSINEKDDDLKEINILISNNNDSLILIIDDTGTGIKNSSLPLLFNKGYSTKLNNRGIGMHLIKSIIDNANGDITIDTEYGVGTCFTITINRRKTL